MRLFHFGLRQKIILLYILLGIIPVILSGSLSYFAYSQDIQRNAEITLDCMQQQCTNDINNRLRNYKNTMAAILTDKQVAAAVSKLGQPSDDLEADRSRLTGRLLSYAGIWYTGTP
jgi:capsular polysaccharide biosynthesis protein